MLKVMSAFTYVRRNVWKTSPKYLTKFGTKILRDRRVTSNFLLGYFIWSQSRAHEKTANGKISVQCSNLFM